MEPRTPGCGGGGSTRGGGSLAGLSGGGIGLTLGQRPRGGSRGESWDSSRSIGAVVGGPRLTATHHRESRVFVVVRHKMAWLFVKPPRIATEVYIGSSNPENGASPLVTKN